MANRKLSQNRRYGGGVKFRAWTASIIVHLIVFTAFGAIKFSKPESKDSKLFTPVAKINRIKKLSHISPIVPKPKIKKPLPSANKREVIKKPKKPLSTSQIFDTPKPAAQNLTDWAKPSPMTNELTGSIITQRPVEFFGSFTYQRKICFVVDCSGSMQGILKRVKKELTSLIAVLQPDQYFYIIFFGGDKLFEFSNSRLIRATEKTKSAAYDFIESIRPAGQTNAMAALQRSMQIRDGIGAAPSVIYFLTDGFELTDQDSRRFSQKVANMIKQFAPATKINTIGFWPQKSDRWMLREIATLSGGECVFINE